MSNEKGLALLSDRMKTWLIETYGCIDVPPAAIPEYIKPEGNLVFLGSRQIDVQDEWSTKISWAEAAQQVEKTIKRFQDKITNTLKACNIQEGDPLFVREWPVFMEDEAAFRRRKFGYYGWVELFCEEVEYDRDQK